MYRKGAASPERAAGEPSAASPAAALTTIARPHSTVAAEICDKPGEITLLLQIARGRALPPVAALDRVLFDLGARRRLIGDFERGMALPAPRPCARTTAPPRIGITLRIYRYFFHFKDKHQDFCQQSSANICSRGQ